jgi:hypothetical protein
LPAIYLASSLTTAANGGCATSVINMNETHVTVQLPWVDSESLYTSEGALILTASAVSNVSNRLSSLNDHLRLDHLNSEERSFIVSLCEEFSDLFYLPADRLTCTVPLLLNTRSLPNDGSPKSNKCETI